MTMRPDSALFTLDWLDSIGWCECQPPKDRCEVCKAKRQTERQRQVKRPQVFTGQPPKVRRLDFD